MDYTLWGHIIKIDTIHANLTIKAVRFSVYSEVGFYIKTKNTRYKHKGTKLLWSNWNIFILKFICNMDKSN